MVVALGGAAAGPTGAAAFLGESVVLNPAKTDLTGPAKSIITKPTFITTNVGEAAALGVAEESAAAGVFQGAGILPALGAVVSFGVGTVIGSEICGVLGIEGCWYQHSDGADPPPGATGGSWIYKTAPSSGETATVPAFHWYWSQNSSTVNYFYAGQGGTTEKCGIQFPSAATAYWPMGVGTCESKGVTRGAAVRYGMANRTLEYHASDDPGISNYSHTAPSNWSEKFAAVLADPGGSGRDKAAVERVGQHIASQIAGSEVKNPYKTYVNVPDCDGLLWAACEDLLEELGLEAHRSALDWQGAVLTKPADAVVQTAPAPGAEVVVPTKVTVTTNPDEAGMPLVIPAIEHGETYDEYLTKLSPGLNPQRQNVGEAFTDPSVGPNAVLRTQPDPGTRLDPSTEHQVDVQTNPPTAPSPSTTPWSAPSVSSIDLGPLAGISIGCNDFPFGIFCWIGDGLSGANAAEACPSIGVPMGSSVGISDELAFDLCMFEPAMVVVRPVLVLLSAFCLAYMFAAAAMGFGAGSNED